ncbi:aldose 1-epimerase [Trueperella bialowiezensis]|uniref:Putative aldose-1-epimerase n=1 Tax=Trueperella bialowiezensis TaxID=312285 RepID=A0A3S4WHI9_9ACTO|nr:aldose 1-epimerase [Trueperella bialowiezensis]VEI14088.1 putative aldose-1-epimerase [Trueperella bialowiezensis]
MAAIDISEVEAFGRNAWKIVSPTGATAVVSSRGATLVSWQPQPGVELISSYVDAKELDAAVGGRALIMAPWAGAIDGGSYSFDGVDYEIGDDARGLAYEQDFCLSSAGSTLSLRAQLPTTPGYPWPVEVAVHYSLDSGADGEEHLSVTIVAVNRADTAAPLSLGWSPHVKLPGLSAVSNLGVSVPARTRILTTRYGVPLPGESAYAGVKAPMKIDYLGAVKLDDYYRGLVPDNYGVVATRVVDPASNAQIVLTQEPGEAPVVHLNTGDGLNLGARESIQIAAMSHVPDAFNRPDAASSIRVAAGQSRRMTATLSYQAAGFSGN